MSASCMCQKVQAKVLLSLLYLFDEHFSLKLRQVWMVKQHSIKDGTLSKAVGVTINNQFTLSYTHCYNFYQDFPNGY